MYSEQQQVVEWYSYIAGLSEEVDVVHENM